METVGARERTWLTADVPPEIAQRFYELAREHDRSGKAHLRHLIRSTCPQRAKARRAIRAFAKSRPCRAAM